MWRIMKSDLARGSHIRKMRGHRGRKAATRFPEYAKRGDKRAGKPVVYTGEMLQDQEWLRWIEGTKPPAIDRNGEHIPRRIPNTDEERMRLHSMGVYMKCPRGWKSSCGSCRGSEFWLSCPVVEEE